MRTCLASATVVLASAAILGCDANREGAAVSTQGNTGARGDFSAPADAPQADLSGPATGRGATIGFTKTAAATEPPGVLPQASIQSVASSSMIIRTGMAAVEVDSLEQAVEGLRGLARGTGGYVANRVYFAMVREAQRVVQEGIATHEEVDQLMVDTFRWPTGPFGMTRGAGSGWT